MRKLYAEKKRGEYYLRRELCEIDKNIEDLEDLFEDELRAGEYFVVDDDSLL